MTENIELVRDRHIDQLIMCAIYVICKVSKEEKSFHEIMKWYRTQSQAKSDVREVTYFIIQIAISERNRKVAEILRVNFS